ncbi:hypothetical protein [Symbiopectobacterium purcellii]|uniref:hypothetical protein n=1 Tax=Symbiopectobacterium purcellii TaxID=2871826 RepID=UPI003F83CCB7
MQQALQYGQNGDFIRLWQVGHFVAFRVGMGRGDIFIPSFELVIYVYVKNEKRLERLKQRERMRFGDDILPGGSQHERYQAFIKWAAGYETTMDVSRNAFRHKQ